MAVNMTHPGSNLEIKVEADRVPMYESQGWQVKSAPKKSDDQ